MVFVSAQFKKNMFSRVSIYCVGDLLSSALTPHGFIHSGSLDLFVTRPEYQAVCYRANTVTARLIVLLADQSLNDPF